MANHLTYTYLYMFIVAVLLMSTKNFLSYGNSETLFAELSTSIAGKKDDFTFKDQEGTAVPSRSNVQFVDSHLTDSQANNKTTIEIIKAETVEQFALETQDGLYWVPDDDEPISAETVGYDATRNVKEALDDAFLSLSTAVHSTNVTEILLVDALPADAAEHPTTVYIIRESSS